MEHGNARSSKSNIIHWIEAQRIKTLELDLNLDHQTQALDDLQ